MGSWCLWCFRFWRALLRSHCAVLVGSIVVFRCILRVPGSFQFGCRSALGCYGGPVIIRWWSFSLGELVWQMFLGIAVAGLSVCICRPCGCGKFRMVFCFWGLWWYGCYVGNGLRVFGGIWSFRAFCLPLIALFVYAALIWWGRLYWSFFFVSWSLIFGRFCGVWFFHCSCAVCP